jgi:hypothetical protein
MYNFHVTNTFTQMYIYILAYHCKSGNLLYMHILCWKFMIHCKMYILHNYFVLIIFVSWQILYPIDLPTLYGLMECIINEWMNDCLLYRIVTCIVLYVFNYSFKYVKNAHWLL